MEISQDNPEPDGPLDQALAQSALRFISSALAIPAFVARNKDVLRELRALLLELPLDD